MRKAQHILSYPHVVPRIIRTSELMSQIILAAFSTSCDAELKCFVVAAHTLARHVLTEMELK